MEFTASEKDFILKSRICRMASVSKETPHNVPVGYVYDKDFYISSDPGAKKVKNILRNNKVCLLIDEPGKPRRALVINGEAEILRKGEDFQRAVELFVDQRGWKRFEEGEQVVIRVKPRKKVSWGLA